MKVLFTADWHIKLTPNNVPENWQIDRFRQFFKKLLEIDCDAIIVGGDIFDKLPSLKELNLFLEFVVQVDKHCIIYDGNHEATKKGRTFFEHLTFIEHLNKNIDVVTVIKSFIDYGITIVPYCKLKELKNLEPCSSILCTHVRGEIPPHVKPEIPLEWLDGWELVLAGDLHAHSNSQRNIVYPGSPMSTHFHRSLVTTGVVLLECETLTYEFIDLKLPQLIRKTIEDPREAIKTDYHHTVYEIKGNAKELSNIELDGVIDKKIVSRQSKARLDLKEKTILEELEVYFKEIEKLDEKSIEELLLTHQEVAPTELQ